MAWNQYKQRWECDRCGKPISATQTVQLCKECNDLLEKECNSKKGTQKQNFTN